MAQTHGPYLLDLGERVVLTYFESFFGLWIASGLGVVAVSNLDLADRALVACLPSMLSLVKGLLAKKVGNPDSASLAPVEGP